MEGRLFHLSINNDVIGKRLRDCRKSKKISLRALAPLVGMNWSNLSKYERGELNFDVEIIRRFSNALKVSEEYFYGNESLGKANALKRWNEEVGTEDFTDAELSEIIKYAKYILAQRTKEESDER